MCVSLLAFAGQFSVPATHDHFFSTEEKLYIPFQLRVRRSMVYT